jgi:GcrA cell cycle regulator
MTAGQRWWTAEDAARVVELRAQGLGPVAIARELGMTTAAVANFLYRRKRRGRPVPPWSPWRPARPQWPPERVTLVLQRAAEGCTYTAIAAALGTTKNAIAGVIHRKRPPAMSLLAQLEARLNWPQVRQTGCRWIDGDPAQPGWRYCGEVCLAGSSWCAAHAARLYQKPLPAERLREIAA